jgi:hypothetical protein
MIRELNAQMHTFRASLAHIDATLKLLDPDAQPRLIKPIRPYRPQNRIFERKELLVRVTTMLREAEGVPMTTEAIAARIVADKGIEAVAEPMVTRVSAIALRSLLKRGVVKSDDGKRWSTTT